MNLPNKITIFRVFLIPLFLVLMLVPKIDNREWWALAVFIIASLTDLLDGYLARKYKLVTNFGKFMDPLADKLLICSALLCFVERNLVSVWIAFIIIAREFIISGFRMVASDNGIVIAASHWAKFKTATQMVMCCLFIANLDTTFFNVMEQIFLYASLVLTIISLVDYIIKNKKVLSNV